MPNTQLHLWCLRYYARKRIAELLATSPHLVVDLGLSRGQAAVEAAKPFWRA